MTRAIGLILLLAVAECLEISLDHGVTGVPGGRATCGVLKCLEERNTIANRTGSSTIASLTVYKRSGGGGRERALVTLNSLSPDVNRLSDSVKIEGSLTAQRAEISLDLVKHADCYSSQFSCELVWRDHLGEERVNTCKLDSSNSQPRPAHHDASDQTLLLQVFDLVQKLVLEDKKKDTLVKNLATSVDSLKTYIDNRFGTIEAKLDTLITSEAISDLSRAVNSSVYSLENRISNTMGIIASQLDTLTETVSLAKGEVLQEIAASENSTEHRVIGVEHQLGTIAEMLTKKEREIECNESSPMDEKYQYVSVTTDASLNSSRSSNPHNPGDIDTTVRTSPSHTGPHTTAVSNTVQPVCEKGMSVKMPKGSSSYTVIQPPNLLDIPYLCDTETDGGGWILIQRRTSGVVNFDRDFDSYRKGFGTLDTDFWLGNENIHKITTAGGYEVRIEADYGNGKELCIYDRFRLADEASHYRLNVGPARGLCARKRLLPNGGRFTMKTFLRRGGSWWQDRHPIFFHRYRENPNNEWGEVLFSEMKIRRM